MNRKRSAWLAAALLATATVQADEMEHVPAVTHAATAKECGECHMAFQPALLPAQGWRRVMATLDDHFGDNATLSPALAADIGAYLEANAGRRGDPQVLRITEQRWWRHEHDEIRASVWTSDEVRSKSNCAACHRDEERGGYGGD